MTRDDRRICRQITIMIGGSLAALYAMGAVMLWLVPPSDMERECVGKSPAELGECLESHRPKYK